AIIEVAHWVEIARVLRLCSLFWSTSGIGIILLLMSTYFVDILLDNSSSRMTWKCMLGSATGRRA
ncbi:NADH-quinone oxidoreductase subunit H, partial [Oceanidesulfovibrio marinus]